MRGRNSSVFMEDSKKYFNAVSSEIILLDMYIMNKFLFCSFHSFFADFADLENRNIMNTENLSNAVML